MDGSTPAQAAPGGTLMDHAREALKRAKAEFKAADQAVKDAEKARAEAEQRREAAAAQWRDAIEAKWRATLVPIWPRVVKLRHHAWEHDRCKRGSDNQGRLLDIMKKEGAELLQAVTPLIVGYKDEWQNGLREFIRHTYEPGPDWRKPEWFPRPTEQDLQGVPLPEHPAEARERQSKRRRELKQTRAEEAEAVSG